MRRVTCAVRYCEERAICDADCAPARVHCRQCNSHQCASCDTHIHARLDRARHDRTAVSEPDPADLCQHACKPFNFADVYCPTCQRNFCYDCDAREHRSGRVHKRVPFVERRADLALRCHAVGRGGGGGGLDQRNESDEPDNSVDEFFSFSTGAGKTITDQPARALWLMDAENDTEQPPHPQLSPPGPPPLQLSQPLPAIQIVDARERLLVDTGRQLCDFLDCADAACRRLPVVSIIGKTGDGKSHTLNWTFFNGSPVFRTSDDPLSCTVGVWVALGRDRRSLLLDTEGLHGSATAVASRQVSLLLKVLVVSDLVIYRARCERLQDDVFTFLSDASRAFSDVLQPSLAAATAANADSDDSDSAGCLDSNMAADPPARPALLVFHETRHTRTLNEVEAFRHRFDELGCHSAAYSCLEYVGVRSDDGAPTDFEPLRRCVQRLLSTRRGRTPGSVVRLLRQLSERFRSNCPVRQPRTRSSTGTSNPGDADAGTTSINDIGDDSDDDDNFKSLPATPAGYFTCQTQCRSCQTKCSQALGHAGRHQCVTANNECRRSADVDNRQYICLACERDRKQHSVAVYSLDSGLAGYALHGYVLVCPRCDVLHRSRQYWYGNRDPVEAGIVRTEFVHLWPDCDSTTPDLLSSLNAGQRVLDGVTYAIGTVGAVAGALPTRTVAEYISDRIAPANWVPNTSILSCTSCKTDLTGSDSRKHHCRACGQGFCDACTSRRVPVRGYGKPVRVCAACVERSEPLAAPGDDTRLRQYSEQMTSACSAVLSGAADVIKSYARPSYWQPDHLVVRCAVCDTDFGRTRPVHHCRQCGFGVCNACSPHRRPVPSRGWESDVRVCNKCVDKVKD